MEEDFLYLDDEEKLKAENDFLKMKMMLERGAQFEKMKDSESLPAEIENEFLKNILEFEKQFDQRKTITIFDKIGRPDYFQDVNAINDDKMEDAWLQLYNYMLQHGVELSATSPAVTARELYRFATEELFSHETDDINIPGMINGFIYDDFYPDYEYENTQTAIEDCIKPILGKRSAEQIPYLSKKLALNKHQYLSKDEFLRIISQFKNAFDNIDCKNVQAESCTINETVCTVTGTYQATGFIGNKTVEWNDTWKVIFKFDDELGYWNISGVNINGISF